MPEDVFRIIVTAAVALAAIAFLVQAVAMAGLYRSIRKMQERTGPLAGKIEAMAAKASLVIEKMGPVVESMGPAIERTGPLVERASRAIETAQLILDETRPRIAEIGGDLAGIVKSGRQGIEEAGELLHDASGRVRARLEQIDRSVDSTVGQVEQVGDAVKRAVTRPGREIGGIAAGISAALSTLAHGRKYPVDRTTQDEEMFI